VILRDNAGTHMVGPIIEIRSIVIEQKYAWKK